MPYQMEWDGRFEVYTKEGELLAKTNDPNYAIEVKGNNQDSYIVDTKKGK
jgi:hypothetical protein